MNGSTHVLVLEHALSTIAERDDCQALCSYRNRLSQIVHLWVAHAFRCHCATHPCIADTGAIDAEQHTQTGCPTLAMIDMCESVHTRELVVVHLAQHAIHHTRCTASRSNFAWLHHIERERVIRLVTTTIRDRCTGRDAQFVSNSLTNSALYGESRNNLCDEVIGETKEVHHILAHLIVLEVPEHAF